VDLSWECINRSQTHECGFHIVETEAEAAQFPEKEYINGILVAVCYAAGHKMLDATIVLPKHSKQAFLPGF
jgi:hypothetical protein